MKPCCQANEYGFKCHCPKRHEVDEDWAYEQAREREDLALARLERRDIFEE